MSQSFIVEPGGAVGILGGGQLGRLLAMSAAQLGLKCHIFCPDPHAPAADVASRVTTAAYDDNAALAEFAENVDVITYEFENVPVETVAALTQLDAIVRPGALALKKAQDRLHEKQFVNELGASTAAFHAVDDLASLEEGLTRVGRPAILKTRHLGYDGKGQTTITDDDLDIPGAYEKAIEFAWAEVGAAPSILEGFVPFAREISIIGARGADGAVQLFDPTENVHRNGILKSSSVPATVSQNTAEAARAATENILAALDYVGIIGVEFFVLDNGDVVINEFAPRVHNSGHWTVDACAISQFEQHIRAVAGWPLGAPRRHSDATMENLIGDEARAWRGLATQPGVCVHLYGKNEVRAGRKMGHVTRLHARRDNS